MGYSAARCSTGPIVGIAHPASGFNNCHRTMPELVEAVKRGVLAAGGLPLEFPTISLGEVFLSPTSLMFRNLMSMDVEEMIRAQPMDAVVLVGGCDKTVPAQLMGAASADVPAIQLVDRPDDDRPASRASGSAPAPTAGASGRATARGEVDATESTEIEGNLATTAGTCAVMGTASTMACIAEALGMSLPGCRGDSRRSHADRLRWPRRPGARAVALIGTRPPADRHHHRAIRRERVARAAGDRRLDQRGHPPDGDRRPRSASTVDLDRLNELAETTPVLVDLKPVGPGLHGGPVRGRRHRGGAARDAPTSCTSTA